MSTLEDPLSRDTLLRLDREVEIAAGLCADFTRLLSEKRTLPRNLDEANQTVLNKLAEVHAVVGLDRLGMTNVTFVGSPDLRADYNEQKCFIEVTRLGRSFGQRRDVWEESGAHLSALGGGLMRQGGAVTNAIWDAIYREIEGKSRQLKRSDDACDRRILWISLGRDYFAVRRYETEGVSPLNEMTDTADEALQLAVANRATGSYGHLNHVVLSLGQERPDLVAPRLTANG